MLSSMTPTIVTKNGKVVLITGSPGGRTIINTVLTIVLGVIEYGLTGREAVDLPRLHHQWLPDSTSIEDTRSVPGELLARLKAMGHAIRTGNRQGDAESIWVSADGAAYGVNDTRTPVSRASTPAHLTAPGAGR
jgi:gamma-glutamyltranspeptidase/glutathione hydrolase